MTSDRRALHLSGLHFGSWAATELPNNWGLVTAGEGVTVGFEYWITLRRTVPHMHQEDWKGWRAWSL